MKNVLVLYNSKTGFSKQYAQWIAEDLDCDLLNFRDFNKASLDNYKLILYGAGLFAGQIRGIGKVKRLMKAFPKKTCLVFATGATPDKEAYQELIFKSNFRDGEPRPSRFFYLLAGINYEKMNLFDRLLMKIVTRVDARKHGKPNVSKQTSIDLTNKTKIDDIVRYVRLKVR